MATTVPEPPKIEEPVTILRRERQLRATVAGGRMVPAHGNMPAVKDLFAAASVHRHLGRARVDHDELRRVHQRADRSPRLSARIGGI